jgi:two-component system, LytTR family, sensor kinase
MKRRILLHSLFWAAYWFLEAYTYSRYDGNFWKYAQSEALQLPARMLATYLSFWSFARFSGTDKAWLGFVGAGGAILAGGLLNRTFKWAYIVKTYFPTSTIVFWNYRIISDILDCALVCGAALTISLYLRQQKMLRLEDQLRAEKLSAELQALKSQINPHFLFNTINNLYALARKKSDKTPAAALKLAGLLRYVLYESAHREVRLEQELQNLRDYVALEKLRFDEDRLQVRFETALDNPEQAVSPLLLLPLVENAFKHGAGEQRGDAFVHIDLSEKQGRIRLKVVNSKNADPSVQHNGFGLKNLRRQLELLYPGRHRLEVKDEGEIFSADLILDP